MTNETKHTPGKWQVKRLNEDYGYGYSKTDIFVDIGENELIKIGTCNSPDNVYYKNVARLIACAPELLKALEGSADDEECRFDHRSMQYARDVIARAKGGTE